jgi:hypothetical protein
MVQSRAENMRLGKYLKNKDSAGWSALKDSIYNKE